MRRRYRPVCKAGVKHADISENEPHKKDKRRPVPCTGRLFCVSYSLVITGITMGLRLVVL